MLKPLEGFERRARQSYPNGKCNLDKDQLANRALYCRVRAERKRTCRIWGRVVEPPIARPDRCIRQRIQPKQRVSNEAVLFGVPKIQTLSGQLSWSHYLEILKAGNELEISFYTKQCEIEKWSVRELKRQMKSGLFQRLALSRNKEEVLTLSRQGQEIQNPQDIVKDPFVLEFVGIPEKQVYLEGELEDRLIANLQDFLLELGKVCLYRATI